MGVLTAETFADWVRLSDVVEHYYQRGEREPDAYVTALLCDGILQAAASQFIINGRDYGLALIPRETWPMASKTDVWSTDRFRLSARNPNGNEMAVSAYDVRVDRDIRTLPDKAPSPAEPRAAGRGAVAEAALSRWYELFQTAYPDAGIEQAWASAKAMFPDKRVTRDQVRALMPDRPLGRPRKNKDNR